jgi:Holliday junction DNA helicase RuvA
METAGPSVEVDVAGVGYEVLVPLVLWPELQALAGERNLDDPAESPDLALHIFYHATANQPVPVLVGFLRRAERDFFRKFTTVEGIGPSKAVKAMNVSVSTIARAIEQEDRAALTRLPGIGARAADKIIATLRGKVIAEAAMHDGEVQQPVDAASVGSQRLAIDAAEAVAALGFSRAEAKRWVEEAVSDDASLTTVEDLTLAVLRRRGAEH